MAFANSSSCGYTAHAIATVSYTHLVRFVVNKLGVISGTGSAVYDHEPVKSNIRRMYAGQISAAVKCTGKGTLALYAYADGLEAARVYVDVK